MTFYVGVVDEGGDGFGVWFPDLPGCTSAGVNMDDLFSKSIEAVRLWIEDARADGEPMPRGRPLREILALPDVEHAPEPVAFIQVPLLLDDGRSVRANISLDAGLLEAIDAAARQSGLTRSGFLASAAREKIERRGAR